MEGQQSTIVFICLGIIWGFYDMRYHTEFHNDSVLDLIFVLNIVPLKIKEFT